jgi:hypothetical protein
MELPCFQAEIPEVHSRIVRCGPALCTLGNPIGIDWEI